jgi:hypothetical protein
MTKLDLAMLEERLKRLPYLHSQLFHNNWQMLTFLGECQEYVVSDSERARYARWIGHANDFASELGDEANRLEEELQNDKTRRAMPI